MEKNLYKEKLKAQTNEINLLKFLLKKEFVGKELKNAEKDIKAIWKLLNLILGNNNKKQETLPDNITQNNVNSYNKFFATVGHEVQKKLDLQINQEINNIYSHLEAFIFENETSNSIEKIIDLIKTKVATGLDDIPAKILKDSKKILSPYIADIVNISYSSQKFPDLLKKAAVKPIYKEKDKNLISNYRPISILPCISKIFEKSAAIQLLNYFERHSMISSCQHAYRPHHSTTTCLFELVNYLHECLDDNKVVAIISLDLSKAFDSINHELLLKKLENFNLSQSAINYIKSYLENRKQVTKVLEFMSTEEKVISGVPQGSILGPFLFLCFVNELPEIFENVCKFLAYADDTQLIVTAENVESLLPKIENIIKMASDWYNKNGLKNNSGKSEVLVLSQKKKGPFEINVIENGIQKTINTKEYIEVLGIKIDQELSWTKHINFVKKSAFNVIRQVHRINKLLPQHLRMTLYQTLVSPIFNYVDIIYGGCTQKNKNKLQVAQNFAVRSILGRNKYESAKNCYKELKLLNLEQRRVVHEAVFVHKSLCNKTTKSIKNKYISFKPKLNTRRAKSFKLNIPQHNASKFKKSPIFRTIQSWNKSTDCLGFGEIKKHKNAFQAKLIPK